MPGDLRDELLALLRQNRAFVTACALLASVASFAMAWSSCAAP